MTKPDFGDGKFEFGRWETPFENTSVDVIDLAWGAGPLWPLVVRVQVAGSDEATQADDPLCRVTFSEVSAFRALDEGGLPEFWWETKARGGRPGLTTFRVRNHAWSHESFLSFFHGTAEGWSHVIATDGLCVEVVARNPPEITLETPASE